MFLNTALDALKKILKEKNLFAFVLTTGDPHASEYPPAHWKFRNVLTPFGGSAGTVIVTQTETLLWTDFRYWEQAEIELEGSDVILMREGDTGVESPEKWLSNHASVKARIGYDATLTTWSRFESFQKETSRANLVFVHCPDLIDAVWKNRPALGVDPVFDFFVAQKNVTEKLASVRALLKEEGATAQFVSSLESVAWLTNLRGGDCATTPVFIAYLWLTLEDCVLFIDRDKVSREIENRLLNDGIRLMPYESAYETLEKLSLNQTLFVDPTETNAYVKTILENRDTVSGISPIVRLKAKKTPEELGSIRDTMAADGAALVETLAWIQRQVRDEIAFTEWDVSEKLLAERRKIKGFLSPSFETIAAFGANAAQCHYAPTAQKHAAIGRDNLLLIDSGGQYLTGTTDITRTVAIGEPTRDMKRDFTAVLRGHIALASRPFPEGAYASQVDTFARAPIWETGADYGHGTGHGVGFALGVHEGPLHISPRSKACESSRIHTGLLVSNEPGLYRPGQWGVRIENLVTPVQSAIAGMLAFETLSLCPIETRLIETAMMTSEEINWVNLYHRTVYEKLADSVSDEARRWLKRATEPV